jgi:CelD/BcsL family acetyltransferase involved in cellulose biosynthesis
LDLATPWERLAESEPTPFASHAWFAAWWGAFGESRDLQILALWDGIELAAILPLFRDIGTHRAMSNAHSPLFRTISRDWTASSEIAAAALELIETQLVLEHVPEDDPTLTEFERAAEGARRRTLRASGRLSPIVETSGDFAAWRAASKPRWHSPLERRRRMMLREHDAEIRVVAQPADLEAELRRGFVVESSGWKGRAGSAILSSPETTRFYEDIARAYHARGELRLSTIELSGHLVAFDLGLLRRGRLYSLKTGFDERYWSLAPGLVLRLSMIERCFELGLAAHELLGDDADWKRKFADSGRAHAALYVYGNQPRALAGYAWRRAVRPRLVAGRGTARKALRRIGRRSPLWTRPSNRR